MFRAFADWLFGLDARRYDSTLTTESSPPEDSRDVAAAIKAALAKEERAIHESENRNVIAALQAIPARASAALTASGFISTALGALGTLLSRSLAVGTRAWDWLHLGTVSIVLLVFIIALGSVAWAVSIILAALPPADLESPLPEENFIETASSELTEDEIDTSIDLYVTKRTRIELTKNKKLLADRIAEFKKVTRHLKRAFNSALFLLAVSVILSIGSGSSPNGQETDKQKPADQPRATSGNSRGQGPGSGRPAEIRHVRSVGQAIPRMESEPR